MWVCKECGGHLFNVTKEYYNVEPDISENNNYYRQNPNEVQFCCVGCDIASDSLDEIAEWIEKQGKD